MISDVQSPRLNNEIIEKKYETRSHTDGRKSVIVTKKEEIKTSTVVTKTIDNVKYPSTTYV